MTIVHPGKIETTHPDRAPTDQEEQPSIRTAALFFVLLYPHFVQQLFPDCRVAMDEAVAEMADLLYGIVIMDRSPHDGPESMPVHI